MLYMTYPCLILPSRYIIENMYPSNIEMNLPIVGQVSKMKWEPSKNWNQFLPTNMPNIIYNDIWVDIQFTRFHLCENGPLRPCPFS
jgi:hypothetical protein